MDEKSVEAIYSQQLVGTSILFKDIPNEVLLSKPTEELLSEAVTTSHGIICDVLKYRTSGEDTDQDEDENDSDNSVYLVKPTEESLLDYVKLFIESLNCNYVYDMGFRCDNKDIKLCWCPWYVYFFLFATSDCLMSSLIYLFSYCSGKAMKKWREDNDLENLSFHHCDGKIMTSSSLISHLESIQGCYFHLGVLHVLKYLYSGKKRSIHTTQTEEYKRFRLA